MKKLLYIFALVFVVVVSNSILASELWVEAGEPKEIRSCGDGVLYEYDAPYGPLMVAHVKGTHYEMGRQYGCLLGDKVIRTMMVYTEAKTPKQIKNSLMYRMVRKVWERLEPHVPDAYKQEMQGIQDGAKEAGFFVPRQIVEAGIGLSNFSDMHDKASIMSSALEQHDDTFAAINAIKRMFRTTCSSFVIWGSRTVDGKVYASRDLDWNSKTGINKYSLLTVYEPETDDGEKLNRYVTAGYAGIIGAVAGMSENGITLGEIGAVTVNEGQDGVPWTILFRQVLEEANDLEEAIAIIENAKGTVGYNFVIGYGDPKNYGTENYNPGGVAIEKNAELTISFCDNDPKEAEAIWIDREGEPVLENGQAVKYGLVMPEAVYRADAALGAETRRYQIADNGPAKENSNGDPRAGGSYKKRYAPHYYFFKAMEDGTEYVHEEKVVVPAGEKNRLVGVDAAIKMVDAVSMKGSNILAVVYNATDLDMWVAFETDNDEEWKPASDNQYVRFKIMEMFSGE